jgi:hypothetical protein
MRMEIHGDLQKTYLEVKSYLQATVIALKVGSGRCALFDDNNIEREYAGNHFARDMIAVADQQELWPPVAELEAYYDLPVEARVKLDKERGSLNP